jgi:hypothetical protein
MWEGRPTDAARVQVGVIQRGWNLPTSPLVPKERACECHNTEFNIFSSLLSSSYGKGQAWRKSTISRIDPDRSQDHFGSIQASILRALEWIPCRINYLGEAPPQGPPLNFFGGAPRLNDQSDRVFILGIGTSSQLQTVFFPIFHFPPPLSYY